LCHRYTGVTSRPADKEECEWEKEEEEEEE
jgi:hypothetical protein